MARPIQTEFERMINRIVIAIRKYDAARSARSQVETGISAALTIHYETAAVPEPTKVGTTNGVAA